MDRRSWLWRRKSSEKSPSGETESSAGSISSLSERFSDDQVLLNHNIQSPEVTSKTAPNDEELNETVKTLSAKLSEALVNIREKEDLVKQHAKVAEEAVSGWEKAEAEVLIQKRLVETANQKNSILEDRISHLDGALKECLRQLRQAREEQEQNVQTSCEWEPRKSELENKLVQLQSQLQAKDSNVQDVQIRLEYVEKQNSILKLELVSISEELKLMTSERDLSTRAAETASKQQLESIKKVAKLEAECRMLKAAQKRSAVNDHKSTVRNDSCKMSSLEPINSDQSSSGFLSSALVSELSQYKHEKPHTRDLIASSLEINLMDDFLEMEELAARPDTVCESSNDRGAHTGEPISKTEVRAAISQTAEVEKLANMEEEKLKLEMELTECQGKLKISKEQLEETKDNLIEVRAQLSMANEARRKLEAEFKANTTKLKDFTEHSQKMEAEIVELKAKLSMENEARRKSEAEFKTTMTNVKDLTEHSQKMEAEIIQLKAKLSMANEAKKKTEAEVESANTTVKNLDERLEEAQIDVAELQAQLIIANEAKRAAEAELEATNVKLKKLEFCLEETEGKCLGLQTQLEMVEGMKSGVEAELEATNAEKYVSESQLKATVVKLQTLLSKVDSLQEELCEERDLHQKTAAKLQKLEIDNSVIKYAHLQKATIVGEFKINKDKEMAVAASRFAECQKTIASINWQLKSLAIMDDFLIDSDETLQIQ
ncbi:filament-like plant protein 3 [Lycium ferocissimum]|uniref:filament-like plant protein 3 n=1 Tax=Lycium ferocissimum TaxID=112874 RepID=UPI002814A3BA|nr:filament-like plant protein 3 [Lycium ferocissimum]XP_059284051.1 filament-like plant protein 3 [Lycium ferocissimum]XP_059284052.1 filament-like plant protein 3 [Lycium ferocissimum]